MQLRFATCVVVGLVLANAPRHAGAAVRSPLRGAPGSLGSVDYQRNPFRDEQLRERPKGPVERAMERIMRGVRAQVRPPLSGYRLASRPRAMDPTGARLRQLRRLTAFRTRGFGFGPPSRGRVTRWFERSASLGTRQGGLLRRAGVPSRYSPGGNMNRYRNLLQLR
jgi:hypothetical protein